MNVFFTADPHYAHYNILRYTSRPWNNVDEMNEGLIKNWNDTVPKGDSITYIVGDFAWKDHNKFLSRLNGKKVLIIGSHDHMSQEVYKNFTEVCINKMLKIDGKFYFLNHTCQRVWERSIHGVPHIFGHSHARLETYNLSLDCGVDTKLAGFKPIHQTVIDEDIERRKQMMQEMGRVNVENGKTLYRQDDVNYWRFKAGIPPTQSVCPEGD